MYFCRCYTRLVCSQIAAGYEDAFEILWEIWKLDPTNSHSAQKRAVTEIHTTDIHTLSYACTLFFFKIAPSTYKMLYMLI